MERALLRGRGLLGPLLTPPCCRRRPVLLSTLSSTRLCYSTLPHAKDADRFKLPETPCRTRFAPSPTGLMHLGSLRTALYNYLLARATGGQFVLRIEDTDQTRLVAGAEESLIQDLAWANLRPDESPHVGGPYGPYRQSERLSLYKEHAEQLVREGKAYRCFCDPDALEELKKTAHESGQPTLYPGTCRDIPLEESDDRAHRGQPYAIRFKSGKEPLVVEDIIYRRFRNQNPEDDFVILKRDGFPTYHFANVVDDHHMKITHVIRGAEWLVSTPKHVELYNAFGWEPPKYGHLGLLVDQNRQKLSKRDLSSNLSFYRDLHVVPPALLNFLLFLGWRAPPGKDGVLTLQEMIENFNLQFSKGDIVVDLTKLRFLHNKHLARLTSASSLTEEEKVIIDRDFITPLKDAIRHAEGQWGAAVPERVNKLLEDPCNWADLYRATTINESFASLTWDKIAAAATSRLRYLLWNIPSNVLRETLREGKVTLPKAADGTATPAPPMEVARAVRVFRRKFDKLKGGRWNEEKLKQVMENVPRLPSFIHQYASAISSSYPSSPSSSSGSTPSSSSSESTPSSSPPPPPSETEETSPNPTKISKDVQVFMYTLLRWALAGTEHGLPLVKMMMILGREETLNRLLAATVNAVKVANVMEREKARNR